MDEPQQEEAPTEQAPAEQGSRDTPRTEDAQAEQGLQGVPKATEAPVEQTSQSAPQAEEAPQVEAPAEQGPAYNLRPRTTRVSTSMDGTNDDESVGPSGTNDSPNLWGSDSGTITAGEVFEAAVTVTKTQNVRALLELQSLRNIKLRLSKAGKWRQINPLRATNYEALLLHIVGEESSQSCTRC